MTRRLALAPLASAVVVIATLFAAGAQAAPSPYVLDPHHTQVTFGWTHFGFSHLSGRFDKVDGTFLFDPAAPAKSSVEVSIPIASISTGVTDLDDDLRSNGFFDAAKFPTATFKSTSVKSIGKDKLVVSGDLTIHGVTRPVTLDVTINKVGMHPMAQRAAAGFDASTIIKRTDFGISKYAPNVSDEIQIHISTETMVPKKS